MKFKRRLVALNLTSPFAPLKFECQIYGDRAQILSLCAKFAQHTKKRKFTTRLRAKG
ncbi:hypothetical protein [Campylobacter showae]|uniref:hypothetical protein n=1 Tax=Campylobacter showae TaxID=204 RepID=UPI0013D3F952|nr:hypothetical protein [Campylobacter showae]